MANKTRRQFLKGAAAAGGVLAAPWPAGAAEGELDMTIARWSGDPVAEADVGKMAAKLTEKAIEALGGMKRFVSKGDVVWVKPNIAWNRTPEQAANTNPDIVAALARMCFDAGAKKVKVGDRPCNDAEPSYLNSGIRGAAEAVGAEVVLLDERRHREMAIGGKALQKWPVFPEIVESDLVINVPIVKHHSITGATICMKNYMGVAGGKRSIWHQNLATSLCDITRFMKPRLSVVDAVRILTRNGPTGGNLADVARRDVVAAGTDTVALDAFGVEVLGLEPSTFKTVVAGHEAGLGEKHYRKKRLKELKVTEV